LLAAYRSLTIGKSLVTRVYRTRAYWLAALMIILAVFSADVFSSALANYIGDVGFFVFLLALLLFIDSNMEVALEIDFFHRDIFRWHKVRTPLFAIIVGYTVIAILATIYQLSSPAKIAFLGYFALLGVTFSYSGATMFVAARRTYDRTMKKFVKMIAYAILFYVLFLTLFIPLDAIYPSLGDVVTDYILIVSAYFFYRAAMSLSSVGKIIKEAA
jgi:hypothetical protein